MQPSSLLLAAAALVATAPAAAAAPLYRATLASPGSATVMVRDVRWTCMGSTCAAPRTATAPDANVCAAMARKLGPVTSFAAADRAFDADELAKCNAAAQ